MRQGRIEVTMSDPINTYHYFVDEVGDLTLFNKRGKIIVGQSGVSNFFMVGVARLNNPEETHRRLEALRQELLTDPYFKNVPSMQAQSKKTALAFHAKNDLPEVRREVFKVLQTCQIKVQIVIRRKSTLVTEAQTYFRYGRRKLNPNEVYMKFMMIW